MGISCIKGQVPISNKPFLYQYMIKSNRSPIDGDYELLELIGRGTFAQVYRAKCKSTGQMRAIKKIKISKGKKDDAFMTQYQILREMDHPNILKIFQIFEDQTHYFIVTELCRGHELFEQLMQYKKLSQQKAAHIFLQIASSIRYLHSQGVMHRDIKPENMIYDPINRTLKIVDFGSAIIFQSEAVAERKRAGTAYYIAPEVIDRKYNQKCDVWSVGVTLFVLLAGEAPFNAKEESEIMQKIKNANLVFKSKSWSQISQQAKNLIKLMLKKDFNERPTMFEVMEHPWVKMHLKKNNIVEKENEVVMTSYLKNMAKLKKFQLRSIQGGVFVFLVNFMSNPCNEGEMMKCFQELDLNKDGVLSVQELSQGLKKYFKCSESEALSISEKIAKKSDVNHSGYIDYSEFVVSASKIELTATQQNLAMAFDLMDCNRNGSLSVSELRDKLGCHIEQKKYFQLLKEFNLKNNEEITKQNFISIMHKLLQK